MIIKNKEDLFSHMVRNGATLRSEAVILTGLSPDMIDKFTDELIQKHFILKDSSEKDPVYSVNWDFFDILSHQKKPEYRKGNIDDILNKIE